ncbi:ubiquitin carboxyl-terminal hydrolase [Coemansia sp. RSA 1365]|nr:ubiquitin carboxyl-terminal hydrolase [Coemansia sp. RSA 1365]
MSDNGNWCLIESDPGVFTELINNMGVSEVQVEELYSLDVATLRAMEPVHGLIFLFKWQAGAGSSDSQEANINRNNEEVYFAQQIIQNACATQAILSVLLNRAEDIELGETLRNLRSFSVDLPPDMRGLALTNCDQIRDVHNSFARAESFLSDEKRTATADDDVFHFISYVPVNGRLYELDGLKDGPIDHGATDNWLEDVGGVIQKRMSQYSQSEIRFNLMAVIGDRRKILNQKISTVDADILKLMERLDALRLDDRTESREEAGRVETQIGALNSERAGLEHMVGMENEKFRKYRTENSLRKHNFIPFVYQLLRGMSEKGTMQAAIANARDAAKRRPSRQEPKWQ